MTAAGAQRQCDVAGGGLTFRPIEAADMNACTDVFFAAEDDLYDRRGLAHLPRNTHSLERLLRHVTATNPGRAWLAEDGAEVVAFGMASQRERFWFLCFLFVRPAYQSRGAGRAVLERCLPAPATADVLGTCVEAIQPVSTALYARHGLVPRDPIYTMTGALRGSLPRLPDGHELVEFGDAAAGSPDGVAAALDSIDREVMGFARPEDHRAWMAWDRHGFVLQRAGEPVGFGYAAESGRVGPVVVREARLLLPLVGELTRRVQAVEGWQLLVPGSADRTLVALLEAGLRLDGPPGLLCLTRRGPDLSRALPGSFAIL